MTTQERKLRSRFRGALLGCAAGDALGFPYRDHSRTFLRSLAGPLAAAFPPHRSGFYPAGQYTDDTQTALAVADAIIEAGAVDGPTAAERLIPLWRDGLVVGRSAACSEVMERLAAGAGDWRDCALPLGRMESCCLSRTIPVGLWDHYRPPAIPDDAEAIAAITHRDHRATAAAAAVAAAVAHNAVADDVILGGFLDRAAGAAGRFDGELAREILDLPRILSRTEFRAFEIFARFSVMATGDPPPPFEEGVKENALHVLLAAIYFFLKSPFDFEKAVEAAVRAGGATDTVAALTGAMSGALLGQEGIPEPLASGLIDPPAILDRADRLLARWLEIRGPTAEEPASPG